jgi:hypothetical protein
MFIFLKRSGPNAILCTYFLKAKSPEKDMLQILITSNLMQCLNFVWNEQFQKNYEIL